MNSMTGDAYLEHYGVKGMHWGVTRKKPADPRSMSDEELHTVIKRMRLEQEYKRLTTRPSSVQRGLKYVNDNRKVLTTLVTTIASGASMAAKVHRAITGPLVPNNFGITAKNKI